MTMPVQKFEKPNKTIQCIRMLKILKAKKYVKKDEIAYLLGEQTSRNINNYKNTLYDAGYPIAFKSGKYGGYYLEYDAMLPSKKLNDDEINALRDAYSYLLKDSNVPNKRVVLDCIGNLMLGNESSLTDQELSVFGHFPLSMPHDEIEKRYYLLQTAIDAKKKVKILYKGYNNDNYKVIHPYKLFKFTNWHVFGLDETANRDAFLFNKFKLHRIKSIEVLDENYTVPFSYHEKDHFDTVGLKDEEIIHVKLKIFGNVGRTLDEKIYGENQFIQCLNKRKHIYLFEADMKNRLVVLKFILSFGSKCEVIEPIDMRNQIIYDAKKTIEYYNQTKKSN